MISHNKLLKSEAGTGLKNNEVVISVGPCERKLYLKTINSRKANNAAHAIFHYIGNLILDVVSISFITVQPP